MHEVPLYPGRTPSTMARQRRARRGPSSGLYRASGEAQGGEDTNSSLGSARCTLQLSSLKHFGRQRVVGGCEWCLPMSLIRKSSTCICSQLSQLSRSNIEHRTGCLKAPCLT
ncbi:hypothetical protein T484DRAFT_1974504 [Baffinella frigidus]|nr:hypothetical protein T484DRAFT_1974504 [Cryptophyta sp. CCMP2293]